MRRPASTSRRRSAADALGAHHLSASCLAILVAAVLALVGAAGAGADNNIRILEFRVLEQEEVWIADTEPRLGWRVEGGRFGIPPGAQTHYRLFGPAGQELAVGEFGRAEPWMEGSLAIPPARGESRPQAGPYGIELWVRSDQGVSPSGRLTVWVDNHPPGPVSPSLGAEWFRGDQAPVLRIGRPAGPLPASGIRGYAVSVRPGSGAPPCAGPARCSRAETDLRGGIGDDTLSLGLLPEGVHVATVVAVSGSGMRSLAVVEVPVRIDATRPDLVLRGLVDGWSSGPVRILAKATDPLSGMRAAGPAGPRTTIAVDGDAPVIARGGEAEAVVRGEGVHTVLATARDAVGNSRGEDAASPPPAGLVRIDETPPTVAFVRRDPGAPERILATVEDELSGPAARGSIAVRPLGSAGAFEPLSTTATADGLSAHWDSDAYPLGAYEFRATAFDRAGNAAGGRLRGDGVPMVLVNPVKDAARVALGFGGRRLVWQRCQRLDSERRRCRREVIGPLAARPPARVVPFGRGLQVSGRVIAADGSPLVGAAVALIESFDSGAPLPRRVTWLRTGADGGFGANLAAGPSRDVEAHYGGSRLHTRAASRVLRFGVRTAIGLRATSARATIGGAPIVFSGRIERGGAAIPAYGRPVHFQFRLPGTPWTEFRTVQTDALGRFRLPYAFSDDDSRGVRFLFRAYAPPQPGWPFEPAVSRPVAVTGA